MPPSLPSYRLAQLQSEWLKPARSRLLRAARIDRAERILDLACGWGQIAIELAERSHAHVVGVDHSAEAIEFAKSQLGGDFQDRITFLQADATSLPIDDHSQDIVFIQCGLMWMPELEIVLTECHRVLRAGGHLVALEPDYGGMMEYPDEIASREIWHAALEAAGADPMVGRKLPTLCRAAGFDSDCYFLDRYEYPHRDSLSFLKELPLTSEQQIWMAKVEENRMQRKPNQMAAHLPFWLVLARR